jgi:hypothetical protein
MLALGCAKAAMAGKWLNFPLSAQLRGMDYALGPYVPGPQHAHILSFGVVGAGLILAGAVMFSLRWWRGLAWTGVLLVWLAILAPLKATLLDARLLQIMAVEASQQQLATAFTLQALPVNAGTEPTVPTKLNLDTVEDRLTAAWTFAHGGWWMALFGGLLAVGTGAARTRSGIPWYYAGAGAAGLVAMCSALPALAECELMRAHAAEARCDLDGAEGCYRRAMRLDGWQRLNIDNYSALGCLDEARARRDTAEYLVYQAQLPSTQVDVTAALGELERVRTSDPTFARVVRRREAELETLYARQLHAEGAYGAAVAAGENALERDPDSLLAAYYLSRDYYLTGRYADAIALSMRLATALADPGFRANLFSNAGDAYTKTGAYDLAKSAYRLSYRYDYVLNVRGLSALNGPGANLQ